MRKIKVYGRENYLNRLVFFVMERFKFICFMFSFIKCIVFLWWEMEVYKWSYYIVMLYLSVNLFIIYDVFWWKWVVIDMF